MRYGPLSHSFLVAISAVLVGTAIPLASGGSDVLRSPFPTPDAGGVLGVAPPSPTDVSPAAPTAEQPAQGAADSGPPESLETAPASSTGGLPATSDGAAVVVASDDRARMSSPVPTLDTGRAPATRLAAPVGVVFDWNLSGSQVQLPDDSSSTAWRADRGYRLFARTPARHVAVSVPIGEPLSDVMVTGRFRKTGGPPGGGYGLIVRDQSPQRLDGLQQSGRYYVLGAGDRGDVGIWRRDGDTWVDLMPWTSSPAVHPGDAPNELTAKVVGAQLTLDVNGVQVARRVDETLAQGGIGIFAGGDSNEVTLEHLQIQVIE